MPHAVGIDKDGESGLGGESLRVRNASRDTPGSRERS
jgi:hypothetical protein